MDENSSGSTPANDSQVDTLQTVENSIRNHNRMLAEVKDNLKKLNEMLKSYLENDDEYREAAKNAKDAAAKKSAIKQRLLSRPEANNIPAKLEETKNQKHELEEALSYYLSQFRELSGTNEFEDENGDLKQIVYVAKLVKRTGGN